MTDELKMLAVLELVGKLISDAETAVREARRYRGQIRDAISDGDPLRVLDRAEMVAVELRGVSRTNERIEEIVHALINTGTETETGTGTDDETGEQ